MSTKIRGKKLTNNQRKILSTHGIKDSTDWLYVRTKVVDDEGYKCASQNTSNHQEMTIVNRVTGEERTLMI